MGVSDAIAAEISKSRSCVGGISVDSGDDQCQSCGAVPYYIVWAKIVKVHINIGERS